MRDRYSRQQLFSAIGNEGQKLLSRKHVLIVGAGALGCANAEMLARAGVGKLTLIDRDYIEWSNLGRQQLYTEEDAAHTRPKAKAAEERLKAVNSEIVVEGIAEDFHAENAERLIQNVDIVLDGTDNFDTRFIINDVTAKHKVPWVYGGCLQSHGVALGIMPGETPCLQCLIEHVPQNGGTCDTVGIIGPAVQMTASYQTSECLKYLTGSPFSSRFIYFDVWEGEHSSINVTNLLDPQCLSCSEKAAYPYLQKEKGMQTAVLCGRDTIQVRPEESGTRSLQELNNNLAAVTTKRKENGELLIFEVEGVRFVVFKGGRTLIHGVHDVTKAKKLYHRYVGV
ncbi:ThiF family adenylyltransferase [Halobacillus litoralis]|uniref:ThiF family adenylyltransferase n=1 Tax=Halobacillus litoralis TaxID=45668 RepID=UPI002491C58E|nr:ThiF family adenylyltransferase [Halobacillus litoralis]